MFRCTDDRQADQQALCKDTAYTYTHGLVSVKSPSGSSSTRPPPTAKTLVVSPSARASLFTVEPLPRLPSDLVHKKIKVTPANNYKVTSDPDAITYTEAAMMKLRAVSETSIV